MTGPTAPSAPPPQQPAAAPAPAATPTPTPTPTPAPAAPTPAPAPQFTFPDPQPLKRFFFPFPQAGGTRAKPIEISADQYAKTWGQAASEGFFPLGINGQWHGGIHFVGSLTSTAASFNQQDGVRCIADGEVIAWRLNAEPLQVKNKFPKGLGRHSSGFVLVRHRLQYPGTQISGVFYSLYMHLADLKAYKPDAPSLTNPIALALAAIPLQFPDWWPTDPVQRKVGAKAKDKRPNWSIPATATVAQKKKMQQELGIFLYATGLPAEDTPAEAAWVPQDQIITLKPGTGNKRELASATQIFRRPPLLETTAVEVDDTKLDKIFLLPTQTDTVRIETPPIPIKAGKLIGHLGFFEGDGDNGHKVLHLETFAGPEFKKFIEDCRREDAKTPAEDRHILVVEKDAKPVNEANKAPLAKDKWIKLATDSPKDGFWIKIEHGIDGNAEKNAEAKAAAAKAKKKTAPKPLPFVFQSEGTAWIERTAFSNLNKPQQLKKEHPDAWEKFPLQSANEPVKTAFVSLAVDLNQKGSGHIFRQAKDEKGTRWWEVLYPAADDKGQINMVKGWVSDAAFPKVSLCTAWSWPGSDLIDEPTPKPAENYEKMVAGQYTASSPVLKALFAFFDTNKNGVLSTDELKAGWQNPYLATQQLTKLIILQDSEWGGFPMSGWDPLDAKAEESSKESKSERPKQIWAATKECIKNFLFWDQVKGKNGFPSGPRVWHMHPIGLAVNFASLRPKPRVTVALLEKIFPKGNQGVMQVMADDINSNIVKYKLDTPLRMSHFFAQIREEAGISLRLVESLNYRPTSWTDAKGEVHKGLIQIFSYFANHPDEAYLYGNCNGHPANEDAIADRAYGGRADLKNGDVASRDGSKFKGRGVKQLTGRDNYTKFNDEYQSIFGEPSPDFITNPGLIAEPIYGLRSGVFFWLKNKLYNKADTGASDPTVNSITAIINKNTDSYGKRREHFKAIWNAQLFEGYDWP